MAYIGNPPAPQNITSAGITDGTIVNVDIASDAAIAATKIAGLSTVATTGAYADVTGTPTLATVATSGAYSDVTGTPTLATVATTGAYADVTGTPTLATVATSGSYNDLLNLPASLGGTHDFVASGAISNGDVVVLNANGTVSTVTLTTPELNPVTLGTASTFNAADVTYTSSVYDPDTNKVIVLYQDSSTTYPMGVVGTVTGSSITFGTPVVIQSVNSGKHMSAVYDTDQNKVVGFFAKYISGQEEHGQAVVGTVSGTSISFGSVATFTTGSPLVTAIDATYDSTNNKSVVVWMNTVATNRGSTAIVATVSSNSITFGSPTIYDTSGSPSFHWVVYDPNAGKVLTGWRLQSANNLAYVGTVSGTGISFGTGVTYSQNALYGTAVYDPSSQKVLLAFVDYSTSNRHGVCRVATISGTTVSFETGVNFKTNSGNSLVDISLEYSPITQSILLGYVNSTTSRTIQLVRASISGSTVSFQTEVSTGLKAAATDIDLTYDPIQKKFALLYADDVAGDVGTSVVITETSTVSDADNYLGVAAEAIADAATGSVTVIGGVNEGQTGLTVNTSYFLSDDGSLSATNNGRKLGKAVATTKLLIDTAMSGSEMNEYLGGLV
jgi:hypothetical protein